MFCSKCGAQNDNDSAFCQDCGAKIAKPTVLDIPLPKRPQEGICSWCSESMSKNAVKCPHCSKWRKDIDQERVKCYTWAGAGIFPALLLFIGASEGWWVEEIRFADFHFSIKAFLFSYSGLAVILGEAITGYMCLHYYVKVSKKIGAYWWS